MLNIPHTSKDIWYSSYFSILFRKYGFQSYLRDLFTCPEAVIKFLCAQYKTFHYLFQDEVPVCPVQGVSLCVSGSIVSIVTCRICSPAPRLWWSSCVSSTRCYTIYFRKYGFHNYLQDLFTCPEAVMKFLCAQYKVFHYGFHNYLQDLFTCLEAVMKFLCFQYKVFHCFRKYGFHSYLQDLLPAPRLWWISSVPSTRHFTIYFRMYGFHSYLQDLFTCPRLWWSSCVPRTRCSLSISGSMVSKVTCRTCLPALRLWWSSCVPSTKHFTSYFRKYGFHSYLQDLFTCDEVPVCPVQDVSLSVSGSMVFIVAYRTCLPAPRLWWSSYVPSTRQFTIYFRMYGFHSYLQDLFICPEAVMKFLCAQDKVFHHLF